ncbi:MAG: hypothetical protein NVS4B3_28290 [Gemmatimonadaceae bacterium]
MPHGGPNNLAQISRAPACLSLWYAVTYHSELRYSLLTRISRYYSRNSESHCHKGKFMRVSLWALAVAASPLLANIAQGQERHHDRSRVRAESRREAQQVQKDDHDEKCETVGPADHDDDDDECVSAPGGTTPPPPPPIAVGTAEVHGMLWHDIAGMGVYQGFFASPPLAGWTVTATGPVSASGVTGADGQYVIPKLPVGSYVVCPVIQGAFRQTAPGTGVPCPTGFGWSITVPATLPSVWYTGINFGMH